MSTAKRFPTMTYILINVMAEQLNSDNPAELAALAPHINAIKAALVLLKTGGHIITAGAGDKVMAKRTDAAAALIMDTWRDGLIPPLTFIQAAACLVVDTLAGFHKGVKPPTRQAWHNLNSALIDCLAKIDPTMDISAADGQKLAEQIKEIFDGEGKNHEQKT